MKAGELGSTGGLSKLFKPIVGIQPAGTSMDGHIAKNKNISSLVGKYLLPRTFQSALPPPFSLANQVLKVLLLRYQD